ncbi:MAG: CPBP family intramembrane metalloprotease [Deltaproteobacteria bacterium]|jgi:membrane protease YdiL (CAAX protease family)|nr:CPBP family intramembrane metalloprotease [Deltaproteobacteria bacterium]
MNKENNYRLKVPFRILIVTIVLLVSTLSIVIALPLAELLNLDLSELQGPGFNPTVKTLTVIVLYASFQFLLIWLVMRLVHKKSIKTLGFNGPVLKPLLFGTAIGVLMQAIEYALFSMFGSGVSFNFSIPADVNILAFIGYLLLNILFLLTLNSLKEELVFRTYPIKQFDDHPNLMIPLLVLVSLIFAAVHHVLEPFSLDAFASRFSIALLLSFVFYKWRSIWLISGVHNGLNLLVNLTGGNYKLGGLFDFNVETDPSPTMRIVINVALPIIFILLFNHIWKREKQTNKLIFNIKHPEIIKV